MKATEFLRQEHAAIHRLIDEVIACPDVRQRRQLMGTLTTALEIHAQIEEELFYPTLAALSGGVSTPSCGHSLPVSNAVSSPHPTSS
jgi:hypothetical protein